MTIKPDLAMKPPPGTYARIAPRSSLAFKNNIHVVAGVIDPDYRGNIAIGLQNHSDTPYNINKGDRIAQLILEHASYSNISIVTKLDTTERGSQGFGSTETRNPKQTTPHSQYVTPPPNIPDIVPTITSDNSDDESSSGHVAHDDSPIIPSISTMQAEIDMPFQVTLSSDPIDNTFNIPIQLSGKHATLGLYVKMNQKMNRVQLSHCIPGTPAAKIPKWRSMLRNSYVTKYNDIPIVSISHLESVIAASRIAKQTTSTIMFSTISPHAMHPIEGVPQLQHDQLNIIARHLQSIKQDTTLQRDTNDSDEIRIIRKLTRRKLKEEDDWDEWHAAEHIQLDQYETQKTLDHPVNYLLTQTY